MFGGRSSMFGGRSGVRLTSQATITHRLSIYTKVDVPSRSESRINLCMCGGQPRETYQNVAISSPEWGHTGDGSNYAPPHGERHNA